MRTVEIESHANKDAFTGELFAVAYIDCGDVHGTVMISVLSTGLICILADSPLHTEDTGFYDLPSALKYYQRTKQRVIRAVASRAKED